MRTYSISCLKFCKANCMKEYLPVDGTGLLGERAPSSLTGLLGELSWILDDLMFVIISSLSIGGERALTGDDASLDAFSWTWNKKTFYEDLFLFAFIFNLIKYFLFIQLIVWNHLCKFNKNWTIQVVLQYFTPVKILVGFFEVNCHIFQ